jgi:hypothetical protein
MFSGEINDRKERKKVKNVFQNKRVLVPKIAVIRKEEGATAAASPTFSLAKQRWLVS